MFFQGYSFYKGIGGSTGLVAEGETLILNGKPLKIISGTVHYFRVVPEYWQDRLIKLKAAGLNTVETYVPWNLHEPEPGVFNYDGILNIRKFIQTAQELDLLFILRPGPFICSEWEFGGLPSWLLTIPNMCVRTNTEPYMNATKRFLFDLISRVADLQFTRNGPIFLVQVENEYGAYGDDLSFMDASVQQLRDSGIVETLVTSDGQKDLAAGRASNVWMTINENSGMGAYLDFLAYLQPNRPLMVMEYWAGWFDHWSEEHHLISTEKFVLELREILQKNASVNLYVFHGGTSFGFMNGANFAMTNKQMPYEPDITSYDYDAPIGEAGDVREKWYKTKEILQEFGLLADNLPDLPEGPYPVAYGEHKIEQWLSLEDLILIVEGIPSTNPIQMEKVEIRRGDFVGSDIVFTQTNTNQSYGYVLYATDIDNEYGDLLLPELHDRAIVLVNGRQIHIVEYTQSNQTNHKIEVPKSGNAAMFKLQVLVENMGRANFARRDTSDHNLLNQQWKGMNGPVLFAHHAVENWRIYPLQFNRQDVDKITSDSWKRFWKKDTNEVTFPCVLQMKMEISDEPKDTFLDLSGWGRGVVFINGFNIGKYWPDRGPQQTLYVPGPLLRKGKNVILIFELHKSSFVVQFQDVHRLSLT